MILKGISYEEMKGVYEGEEYDFDRYNVEMRSPMATHEFSIVVSHSKKEISGDCIRYGSWGDLDKDEIEEIIQVLESEGEIVRPYDGYTIRGC